MAGDWIKMRSELQSHPKVVRILSALEADKFRVIGGLHAVWAVFDTHSVNGELTGYTPKAMDHVIGWEGFSAALMSVGWMAWDGSQTLTLPEFDEHNGQSAKRRAEDQKRKRNVRNMSGKCADKSGTNTGLDKREEKDIKDSKPVPLTDIRNAYNHALPMLGCVKRIGGEREKHLRARWNEDADRQTLDYWVEFFNYVSQSDFLTGRNGVWTKCDFDWLINETNHVKVAEGKYENQESSHGR